MSERAFVRVKVWGPWACFTRPEMKVERVSYEVITPSAARAILDSILWKPQMRWVVTRISLLSPIRFHSFRRNELQSKVAPKTVAKWIADPSTFEPQWAGAGEGTDATPRTTLALRDVAYLIEAEPHVFQQTNEDTPIKYMAMFNRRLDHGQCVQRPYLGCREFAAWFEGVEGNPAPVQESRDLGVMLYDVLYDGTSRTPVFFQAVMKDGVLDVHPDRVIPDAETRKKLLQCSYRNS